MVHRSHPLTMQQLDSYGQLSTSDDEHWDHKGSVFWAKQGMTLQVAECNAHPAHPCLVGWTLD